VECFPEDCPKKKKQPTIKLMVADSVEMVHMPGHRPRGVDLAALKNRMGNTGRIMLAFLTENVAF